MNIEMFLTAKEVEESLERQETATCLAWCHDNKSRLRKMKVRCCFFFFFFLNRHYGATVCFVDIFVAVCVFISEMFCHVA